jgi:hypothetical protein
MKGEQRPERILIVPGQKEHPPIPGIGRHEGGSGDPREGAHHLPRLRIEHSAGVAIDQAVVEADVVAQAAEGQHVQHGDARAVHRHPAEAGRGGLRRSVPGAGTDAAAAVLTASAGALQNSARRVPKK